MQELRSRDVREELREPRMNVCLLNGAAKLPDIDRADKEIGLLKKCEYVCGDGKHAQLRHGLAVGELLEK